MNRELLLGDYNFTVTASDGAGRTAQKNYVLSIDAPLVNTTTRLNDGIIGSAFTQTLTASGGLAPYTWGVYSGTLPAGLTLNPSTGIITGTPTSATTQSVVLSVTDSYNRVVYSQYTINALNPLQVLTSTLPNGSQNNTYSEAIRTSGGIGPYSYALTGQLPAGLSINASTGVISGTPTATGSTNLSVTVTDSSYPTAQSKTQNLSVRVTSSVTITTNAVLTNAKKGTAITPITLVAKGGTPGYTWAITGGSLPSGLVLDPASGIISGTPTDRGDFAFTIRVTDSVGNATGPSNTPPNPDKQFVMHVSDTLSVTTGAVPNGAVGLPYNAVLTATGGLKNYSWAVKTGTLPAGLTLTAATGLISGTPTANITSNVTFEVTDSDAPAQKAQVTLIFVITNTLSIYEGSVPNSRINQAYSANVRAQLGTPPYNWSIISGTLPAGVTLSQNAGTAVLSGTPTSAGTSTFTLQVSDNGTPVQTVSRVFTTIVYPDVAITTTGLKTAVRGTAYGDSVAATGGLLPYTYSISAGTLPAGLSFNSTSGAITGSVTMATGTSATFTVTVTDSGYPSASVSKDFTIMAIDPLVINTSVIQGALQRSSYSATLNGSGGVAPLSWSVTGGNLPQGVTIDATSGTLAGTAVPCGTFNFTVQLADSATVATTVQQAMQLAVTCSNDYVISGNAGVAGATVALSGAASKTTTADGSGNYSFSPLASGNYTVIPSKYQYIFTPVSKNVAVNNLDTPVTAFTATPDTTPPTLAVATVDNTLTNNAALTVSGTASDASGIQSVTVNGTTVTVSPTDGSYSKAITLVAGANTITVVSTDKAGNQTTVNRTVTLDTTPPALTVAPANNTLTNTATLTVSGTATDASGIQSVTVNGTAVTVSQADGSFTKNITLTNGTNSITVIATDLAGNQTTITRSVILDITPPTVVMSPANNTFTNSASVTVSGTITDSNGVQSATVNGTAVTVSPTDGSFSKAITLTTDTNAITVVATDNAGNQATVTRTITLDTTAPTLTLSSLANGAYTNNATLNVAGSTSDASSGIKSLTVNGQAATVAGNGSFTWPVTLTTGANTITTIATDNAGNTTSDSRTITLDTTAPTLAITAPTDNSLTNQGTITVNGTVSETGTVQGRINNGSWQTAQLSGTTFSITLNLTFGQNTIEITATDLAGNSVATTAKRTVTYDNTAPQLAITTPSQDITTARNSFTLSGTVSDSQSATAISVSHNGQTLTPTITSGAFSQLLNFNSAKTYPVVVTATDAAGNSSSVTRNIIYAPYAVTFVAGANGSLTGTASQTIAETAGSSAVTAVPNTGFGFVNWTGTGGFVTTSANPLTVTNVTSAMTITANFATSVNGSCGSSNGGAFTTAPTVNFCTAGTASSVTGSGPWNWSCSGLFGGTNSPACSAAIQTYTVTAGVTGGNGSVSCTSPVNYGATSTCSVTANYGYQLATFTDNAVNKLTAVTGSSYTISALNASHTIAATFSPLPPVNGVCGSANGKAFTIAPTTNLCSVGASSAVTGSNTASWSCAGLYGGTAAVCSAAIDTTGPTVSLSTLVNGAVTNNATLNIAGTVSDPSGINGVTINTVTVTISNGSFSYPVTLHTGTNTITVVATDALGNQTTITRTITLDVTAPVLTVTTPADNSVTNKTSVAVSGSVNDATATVTAKVNDGNAAQTAMSGSGFSATLNLTGGLNTITITATDLAGNISSVKRSITSDTTQPTLTVTTPVQDITTTQTSITINGTVNDTVTSSSISIAADGQSYTPAVASDGSFSQTIALPTAKTYAIVVTATDQASNSAAVTRNVIKALAGDINGDSKVDIADALKVLRIAVGLDTATADNYARADVAPLKNGAPAPDGVIDIADAVVILERAVGLVNW